MGQYYSIFNISKNETFTPWDLDCGAKLMEFSYFIAEVPMALCEKLYNDWHSDVVIVVGDYYSDIPLIIKEENPEVYDIIMKRNKENPNFNIYDFAANYAKRKKGLYKHREMIKLANEWDAKYFEIRGDSTLSDEKKQYEIRKLKATYAPKMINYGKNFYLKHRYFINYAKGEYIDLYDYFEKRLPLVIEDKPGLFHIEHPVTLLLACGNQLGGGDYYGLNEDQVGSWAFDKVGISSQLPLTSKRIEIEFLERK